MKQKTLIFLLLFSLTICAQTLSVTENVYRNNIAELTYRANYEAIEKTGKYPGVTRLAADIADDGRWTPHPLYRTVRPASNGRATWIDMDLAATKNRTYKDGIFLDPDNYGHYMIIVKATGENLGPARCLNKPRKSIVTYVLLKDTFIPGKEKLVGTSGGTFERGYNTNNNQTTSKRAILVKDNSLDYQTQNGTNFGQTVCLDSYLENDELLEIYNEYTSINHITEKSKYQWKSGFNLDMFDRIQNRELRRAFKKSVTGKTWAGRHVLELIGGGTLIGVGTALLLSSLNNSKGSVNFGANPTN
jgi:hypothetical protein